jgi:glycosyltransferase involved in cell wall biosynthesis
MKKVLLVASRHLGNSTISSSFERVLRSHPKVSLDIVNVYESDVEYRRFLFKIKEPYTLAYRRALLKKLGSSKKNYDLVIIICVQSLFSLDGLNSPKKVALWFDALPGHEFKSLGNELSYFQRIKRLFLAVVYRQYTKNIDYLLPMSDWASRQIDQFYFKDSVNTILCHYGIEEKQWMRERNILKVASPDRNEISILFVGNDLKRKGIVDFLNFLNDRSLILDRFLFKIVTNDIDSIGLLPKHQSVEVITGLSHSNVVELKKVYESADILILPTYQDMMPHVMVEAISLGLPVIATDIAAIGEVVKDDFNGYLIEVGNFQSMYEKIEILLQEPDRLERFSRNAIKHARSSFSEQIFRDNIEKLLSL